MSNNNITKEAIRHAFLDVLKEKPYKKVTVKDISERCGINRNTFYYHYQDIPALFEDIFECEVSRIIEKYPELTSVDDCVTAVMEFGLENKKAIMHIYDSFNGVTYMRSLWRICEYVVAKYIDTLFPEDPMTAEDRALWNRFLKCTLFGMTAKWIDSGMKDEDIEIVRRLYAQTRGVAEMIMQNYKDHFAPGKE